MDIRRAYLRRIVKQARLQKRLAIAAMTAAVGCAAWLLQAEAPRPRDPMLAAAPGASVAAAPALLRTAGQPAPAPRRVYPYSIVPGGVASRAELAHAVMADKAVAAHYLGFAVEHAALRTIARPRAVYVSYRKGDQVYWTARKVTLREGETVLSDGVNDIRTRCGNRISDTPQLPVEAKGPAEQELDTPFEGFGKDDGKLISTSFVLEDLDAGGSNEGTAPQPQHQSYPDGAGLLLAARAQGDLASVVSRSAGQDRVDAAGQPASSYLQGGFTWLADPAPVPVKATTAGSTADNGGYGSVPAADAVDGGSGGKPGSTGGAPTGGPEGSTGGTGGKPETAGPGQPPPAALRPDGLPNDPLPAKPRDVPEPGSLWLSALTFAALLLQRRLKLRRSR